MLSSALNCIWSPTATVWSDGVMIMELTVACVPAPDNAMTVVGFAAVLVIVTVPETLALPDGAKITSILAVCPGPKMLPTDTPLALNPGPEMLTFEIAMLALPTFVRVTAKTLLLPTLILPKARFEALPISCDVAAPEGAVPVVCEPDPEVESVLLTRC
jgi:hypothetical protein